MRSPNSVLPVSSSSEPGMLRAFVQTLEGYMGVTCQNGIAQKQPGVSSLEPRTSSTACKPNCLAENEVLT